MTTTNIGDLEIRDDFFVTIGGTVLAVREDEFLLQDATGQVWVDAYRGYPYTLDLTVGEQVIVFGDLDDSEDFDARQVTRADGSIVVDLPSSETVTPAPTSPGSTVSPSIVAAPGVNIGDLQIRDDFFVTIDGTVLAVREDEFLLQDATGQVWVDAYRGSPYRIDLAVGEQVTVVGDLDDPEDFDALQVTRADGSIVVDKPTSGTATPETGNPGLASPSTIVAAPAVSIGDLQIRDDFFVTIEGTVTDIREDEFLLQDATGQVWVDAYRGFPYTLDLVVGEQVSIIGDLDDPEDFDAFQVTRADGSIVVGQPSSGIVLPEIGNPGLETPPNVVSAPGVNIGDLQIRDDFFVTIEGTVTDIREDEFLLQDATGQVWVDTNQGSPHTLDLLVGEQVAVVGDLDDLEDFDALQVTRADGSVVPTGAATASSQILTTPLDDRLTSSADYGQLQLIELGSEALINSNDNFGDANVRGANALASSYNYALAVDHSIA